MVKLSVKEPLYKAWSAWGQWEYPLTNRWPIQCGLFIGSAEFYKHRKERRQRHRFYSRREEGHCLSLAALNRKTVPWNPIWGRSSRLPFLPPSPNRSTCFGCHLTLRYPTHFVVIRFSSDFAIVANRFDFFHRVSLVHRLNMKTVLLLLSLFLVVLATEAQKKRKWNVSISWSSVLLKHMAWNAHFTCCLVLYKSHTIRYL